MRTWSQFVIPCNKSFSQPNLETNQSPGQFLQEYIISILSSDKFEGFCWIPTHPLQRFVSLLKHGCGFPNTRTSLAEVVNHTKISSLQLRSLFRIGVFPTFLKQNNYAMFNVLDIWTAQCYSKIHGLLIFRRSYCIQPRLSAMKTLPFNTPRLRMDQGWSWFDTHSQHQGNI